MEQIFYFKTFFEMIQSMKKNSNSKFIISDDPLKLIIGYTDINSGNIFNIRLSDMKNSEGFTTKQWNFINSEGFTTKQWNFIRECFQTEQGKINFLNFINSEIEIKE